MTRPLSSDQAPAESRPDREKLSRPALSIEDAETFWNEGSDAVSAQPGTIAHLSTHTAPEVGAPFSFVAPDPARTLSIDGDTAVDVPATGRAYSIVSEDGIAKLALYENGQEAGGGVFPSDEDGEGYDAAVEYAESWVSGGAEAPEPSDCCVGIDQPGVGHVHSPECDRAGETISTGREYVAGEVPQPLKDWVNGVEFTDDRCSICGRTRQHAAAREARRDGLLAQLVFAARDLAEKNLLAHPNSLDGWQNCKECHSYQLSVGVPIEHAKTCRTGRVLRILSELIATLDFDPNRKETAEDGETGRAGDGIRPRGLHERVCLKCGGRGGVWDAQRKTEKNPDLSMLGLNQCIGVDANENTFLYTHRCESLPLYGVDVLFGSKHEGGAQ